MSILDIVLIGLLVVAAVRGFFRGLLREVFGLGGLVGGLYLAGRHAEELAPQVAAALDISVILAKLVAGTGIVLVAWIVGGLLGRIADRLARAVLLGPLNRVAGIAAGVAKGAAALGLALVFVQRAAPESEVKVEIDRSPVARPLVELAEHLIEAGRPYAEEAAQAA
ncbi:MAG: CvpA family protein [bacterium]|nr:CvpA family protein [bacterium]